MLIVKVRDGETIDSALKRLKYKVIKTKIIDELRERSEFEKKSVKRKNEIKRAAYRQRQEDEKNKS